jgi:hypothetical protein
MDSEGMKKHSLRFYRVSECVYRDSGWNAIQNWVWCKLGANFLDNGMMVEAGDSFKYAFNQLNDRQSKELHNQLIADWKKVYRSTDGNR